MGVVNNIASGFAAAKAYVTGSDTSASKTTITTNPTDKGGSKTTIKTVGANASGGVVPPPLPPRPSRAAIAGAGATGAASMAPRAALPGMAAGGNAVMNSAANANQVQHNGAEVGNSINANSELFAHIQQSAFAMMQFQRDNAQLQSLTKASEAAAKQIKNIGEGIKSTGAQ